MLKIVVFVAGLLLFFPATQYALVWKDTCYISNTVITPDVKSKGIMGVKIAFDSYLLYDVKHKNNSPQSFMIEVSILNDSGKLLPVLEKASVFNHRGYVSAVKSTFVVSVKKKDPKSFFIPYYCLDLPPGIARLKFNIKVSVKDSSQQDSSRAIALKGFNAQNFSIIKPPTRKMRMLCTGVRVSATDKGKAWDFGLYGLPDPVFKVVMDNGVQADYIYHSSTVNNSLSAAWIDPSPAFVISEGDEVTLSIYDNDTLSDDLIGSESHTLDEWLEISKTAKELAFGQVTYCTVKVEKVN